eukprot:TRINITY_DN1730_c0_g2_i1.p1 TRINITY_DN1730_c0_g2~~TRINITY_DN1730_c0_g2_i1.p1  ORF type:complete len:1191 (+),score=371.59 TRINITY_DN1730_c0_g2_i1:76-3573(+)
MHRQRTGSQTPTPSPTTEAAPAGGYAKEGDSGKEGGIARRRARTLIRKGETPGEKPKELVLVKDLQRRDRHKSQGSQNVSVYKTFQHLATVAAARRAADVDEDLLPTPPVVKRRSLVEAEEIAQYDNSTPQVITGAPPALKPKKRESAAGESREDIAWAYGRAVAQGLLFSDKSRLLSENLQYDDMLNFQVTGVLGMEAGWRQLEATLHLLLDTLDSVELDDDEETAVVRFTCIIGPERNRRVPVVDSIAFGAGDESNLITCISRVIEDEESAQRLTEAAQDNFARIEEAAARAKAAIGAVGGGILLSPRGASPRRVLSGLSSASPAADEARSASEQVGDELVTIREAAASTSRFAALLGQKDKLLAAALSREKVQVQKLRNHIEQIQTESTEELQRRVGMVQQAMRTNINKVLDEALADPDLNSLHETVIQVVRKVIGKLRQKLVECNAVAGRGLDSATHDLTVELAATNLMDTEQPMLWSTLSPKSRQTRELALEQRIAELRAEINYLHQKDLEQSRKLGTLMRFQGKKLSRLLGGHGSPEPAEEDIDCATQTDDQPWIPGSVPLTTLLSEAGTKIWRGQLGELVDDTTATNLCGLVRKAVRAAAGDYGCSKELASHVNKIYIWQEVTARNLKHSPAHPGGESPVPRKQPGGGAPPSSSPRQEQPPQRHTTVTLPPPSPPRPKQQQQQRHFGASFGARCATEVETPGAPAPSEHADPWAAADRQDGEGKPSGLATPRLDPEQLSQTRSSRSWSWCGLPCSNVACQTDPWVRPAEASPPAPAGGGGSEVSSLPATPSSASLQADGGSPSGAPPSAARRPRRTEQRAAPGAPGGASGDMSIETEAEDEVPPEFRAWCYTCGSGPFLARGSGAVKCERCQRSIYFGMEHRRLQQLAKAKARRQQVHQHQLEAEGEWRRNQAAAREQIRADAMRRTPREFGDSGMHGELGDSGPPEDRPASQQGAQRGARGDAPAEQRESTPLPHPHQSDHPEQLPPLRGGPRGGGRGAGEEEWQDGGMHGAPPTMPHSSLPIRQQQAWRSVPPWEQLRQHGAASGPPASRLGSPPPTHRYGRDSPRPPDPVPTHRAQHGWALAPPPDGQPHGPRCPTPLRMVDDAATPPHHPHQEQERAAAPRTLRRLPPHAAPLAAKREYLLVGRRVLAGLPGRS